MTCRVSLAHVKGAVSRAEVDLHLLRLVVRVPEFASFVDLQRLSLCQSRVSKSSGIVLVAINPYAALPLYSHDVVQAYSGREMGALVTLVSACAMRCDAAFFIFHLAPAR